MTQSSETTAEQSIIDLDSVESGTSLWEDAWNRLQQNKLAMFGGGFLLLIIVISLLTPCFIAS